MVRVLILGATGLVGEDTLRRALSHPDVKQVIAPTRRALPAHEKLINPVASDLDALLPNISSWSFDSVICALGTTITKAGSKEAFRHVDYALPLSFAKAAHQQGTDTFALVSAIGASASSRIFYVRTKGELERDLEAVGFKSLAILRPGLIGGNRKEFRAMERLSLWLFSTFQGILPRRFRVNPASRIAQVLVEAVVTPVPGLRRINSHELV
jgi:uncharacterized protein YbjT (DUF2867 family)